MRQEMRRELSARDHKGPAGCRSLRERQGRGALVTPGVAGTSRTRRFDGGETQAQLAGIRYRHTAEGRVEIESKGGCQEARAVVARPRRGNGDGIRPRRAAPADRGLERPQYNQRRLKDRNAPATDICRYRSSDSSVSQPSGLGHSTVWRRHAHVESINGPMRVFRDVLATGMHFQLAAV